MIISAESARYRSTLGGELYCDTSSEKIMPRMWWWLANQNADTRVRIYPVIEAGGDRRKIRNGAYYCCTVSAVDWRLHLLVSQLYVHGVWGDQFYIVQLFPASFFATVVTQFRLRIARHTKAIS